MRQTFIRNSTGWRCANCGVINRRISRNTSATGGYEALGIVLTEKTPEDVIQILLDSGLRGRGGAGIPTGLKWKFAAANEADQKYVCCNADEGDPGAFMDRSILEGDPHAVLEAMAIAGYAIGASQGYIYVRAEYPIAVKRLQIAINQAREYGLLGENIFDTGFNFDIELRLGAGAFVCGEETALMTSIEGNRGEPRPRPPFPALKGLFQKPRSSITWRPTRTSRRSSSTVRNGSHPWVRRNPKERKYSPWAARSTIPDWWKCPWERRSGRSLRKSAAAFRR